MDFKLTKEQVKSRTECFEVCKELAKDRPNGFFGFHSALSSDEGWEYHRHCVKDFAKRGWLSFGWPPEHGEKGTIMDRVFLAEARGYHDVPGVRSFWCGNACPDDSSQSQ